MSEKNENVPKIRFPGFTEPWEQRKLKEVANYFNGGSYEKDIVDAGKYELITLKSVEMNGSLVSSGRFIEKNVATLRKGTLVMILSEQSPGLLGMTAEIPEDNRYVLNQRVAEIRPHYGMNSQFLVAAININQRYFSKRGAGTKVQNISKSNVENYEFLCPIKEEQNNIGCFLKEFDNLITLHQRKLSDTRKLKAGLLQKIFPKNGASVPEVRFPGFTHAWEQRKLGDVLTEIKRPVKMKDNVEYQLVTVKRQNEGVVSRGFFKGKNILVKNYFEIKQDDYLISKRQVVHGANGIVPKELDGAIVSNEYLISIGNDNITTSFLTLISRLPQMYKKFFLSSYGIDVEKLVFDVKDWKKRFVLLPTIEEQNIISDIFKQLDNLITLHQRKLDHLEQMKKSLLQQMFV